MDSEKYLVYDEKLKKEICDVAYLDGRENDISNVENYIEFTRALYEIYQWFDIFNYNLEGLKNSINIKEKIGINANFINLVSGGKNLIESISGCVKYFCNDEKADYFDKQYIKGEYDKNFSYRLLTRLRNFSQHNHIPVSCRENVCLDLHQIYETPHYSFNKTLQKEVSDFMEEIEIKYNGIPALDIQYTVTSYVCSVYKIYKAFLTEIRCELLKTKERCYSIFKEKPELIEQPDNKKYEGFLFYFSSIDDNIIHTFNTREEPENLLISNINKLIDLEKKELEILKKIKESSIELLKN